MITALSAPARRPATAVLAIVVALLVTMLVPATARAADAGAEQAFVAAVNRERAAAGLPALAVADDLVAVARRQAVRMADAAELHHNSNLTGEVAGWQKVGENVGRGPSVEAVQDAFMASPSHRANVLESDWTEIGLGVEVRDGRLWVVEVFRLPAAAPEPSPEAPPAPAPAAPEPADVTEPAHVTVPAAAPAVEPTPAAAEPADATEPAPEAGAGDRALVMLERVSAHDAALDAA